MANRIPASRRAVDHLRQQTGRQHALLTGRAAAGIWALLQAWGFRDRVVLLPANTCYIVLWAVLKSGNYPRLVDVDRRTGNLTVETLQPYLDSYPAALIPCHIYGLAAPIESLCAWTSSHGIKVIEDAALALGAQPDGRPAGSWGDASILSFGLGKIVDHQVGGALLTDDPVLASDVTRLLSTAPRWDDRLLALTNQWNGLYWPLHQYEAQTPRLVELYPHLFALYSELTVYQLAPDDWDDLPALLRDLPHNLAHRARLTTLYDESLVDLNPVLSAPLARPSGSILWRYPVLVPPVLRDDLLAHLWEQGIHEATRWYPSLRPMTTALAPHLPQPDTPVADQLGASIINLPLDAATDESSVRHICECIHGFFA